MTDSQLSLGFEDSVQEKIDELLTPYEIFDRADEDLLKKLAEDKRIERKPGGYIGRQLAEYVCMWGNTSGRSHYRPAELLRMWFK